MTNPGEEYHGPMPKFVKPIKRRKNEKSEAFNLRKARIRRAAFEIERARREAEWEKEHPSDTPLQKFARVWEGESNSGTVDMRPKDQR